MSFRIFLFISFCLSISTVCLAQGVGAEYRTPGSRDDDDGRRRPLPINESFERMKIEKSKKEHEEMLSRGVEILKRSTQLENSVAASGGVYAREIDQLVIMEKLAKQIRRQLGGDDDDDKLMSEVSDKGPMSSVNAVKSLKTAAEELDEELKKTSRFTVSAAAILSSNEVLRLIRYIRSSNSGS
jgi:hypothetical protein